MAIAPPSILVYTENIPIGVRNGSAECRDTPVQVAAIGGKLFAGHRWASEGALAVGAAGVADLQVRR